MSKIIFTKEQINLLRKNNYVKHVSEKGITYTKEFKEYFVNEYGKGMKPTQIFENVGLQQSILGKERIYAATKRFRKCEERFDGFEDRRKGNSGRPATKHLTTEEKLKRAEDKIMYLQQENEFLKKIQRIERKERK